MERLFQKIQKEDYSEINLTWKNRQENGKEYKINVRNLTMKEQGAQHSYRYHNYGDFEISRQGFPYPKYGNKDKLKTLFSQFDKKNAGRFNLYDIDEERGPLIFFEKVGVNGANVDGLIFHAIAQAPQLFEFEVELMADCFAMAGCNSKKDVNMKIQEMKNALLGTMWSGLTGDLKKTRKKQMKKLAKQLFEICQRTSNQGVRELPYIPAPKQDEEEEVKGAGEESDSEEEQETLHLPLVYTLLYIQQPERFPLAKSLHDFMIKYLTENKKYGLTRDEWENIAEFLFTVSSKDATDPDSWPTLLEEFIKDPSA